MDERLAKVEQEKQSALAQSNNTYNQMLKDNQNLYNQNLNYANTYEQTQNGILDKQLEYNTNLINQQKEIAQENKEIEEIKAKNDYQAFINPYGNHNESLASQGLLNSGVSETSKLGGYNTYQNRLATANKTLQNAITQYDNEIAQARLNNDTQRAQNALNKLQMQIDFAKEFYNSKNTITQNQLTYNQDLDNNYYNRYQTEYNNIQNEKAREEAIRQYEKDFAEKQRQYNESMAYQKERDAIADSQWEKEYALSKQKSYSGGSSSGYRYSSSTNNTLTTEQTDAFGNNSETMNKSDYYWKKADGSYTDQPSYINNTRLNTNGVTAGDIGVIGDGIGSGYRIWQANGKYYVWNNNQKTYYDVTDEYKQATKLTLDNIRANIKANNGVYKK